MTSLDGLGEQVGSWKAASKRSRSCTEPTTSAASQRRLDLDHRNLETSYSRRSCDHRLHRLVGVDVYQRVAAPGPWGDQDVAH
jgi:hypothetical protein